MSADAGRGVLVDFAHRWLIELAGAFGVGDTHGGNGQYGKEHGGEDNPGNHECKGTLKVHCLIVSKAAKNPRFGCKELFFALEFVRCWCLVLGLKREGISVVSRSNGEIAFISDYCSVCVAEVEMTSFR